MDIHQLQPLHCHASQYSRNNTRPHFDVGVGHEYIQGYEQCRHQDIGREVEQETESRGNQKQIGQRTRKSGKENAYTRSYDNHYRNHKHQCEIVGEGAENTPFLLHLPYIIECLLDIGDKHYHCVKHEYKTKTKKHPAFGVNKITIDKTHDDIGSLGLRAQGIAKPYLYILVIAESPCHCKHNGEYRNNGKQSGISEGRGIVHHTLCGEELHGEHHLLQYLKTEVLQRRHVFGRHTPYINLQKTNYSFIHHTY